MKYNLKLTILGSSILPLQTSNSDLHDLLLLISSHELIEENIHLQILVVQDFRQCHLMISISPDLKSLARLSYLLKAVKYFPKNIFKNLLLSYPEKMVKDSFIKFSFFLLFCVFLININRQFFLLRFFSVCLDHLSTCQFYFKIKNLRN